MNNSRDCSLSRFTLTGYIDLVISAGGPFQRLHGMILLPFCIHVVEQLKHFWVTMSALQLHLGHPVLKATLLCVAADFYSQQSHTVFLQQMFRAKGSNPKLCISAECCRWRGDDIMGAVLSSDPFLRRAECFTHILLLTNEHRSKQVLTTTERNETAIVWKWATFNKNPSDRCCIPCRD